VSSDRLALLKAAVKSLPGVAPLGRWMLTHLNSEIRAEQRLLRDRHPKLYQSGGRTGLNRYPQLFTALREALVDAPAPQILSFGCSTGEEILSLRTYIPAARLFGIDLNPQRIATARRRIADPSVRLWGGRYHWRNGCGAVRCHHLSQRAPSARNRAQLASRPNAPYKLCHL